MNSPFLPLGSLMQNNHKSVVLVTLLTSIISTSDESPFFFIFLPSLICFLCRLIIRLFFPSLPFLFQCTNAVAVVICKNSATTSGLVWSQMSKIMTSKCKAGPKLGLSPLFSFIHPCICSRCVSLES